MEDKTLLEAIGQIMDSKLEPIRADIQSLKTDVTDIKERLVRVEITQENIVIPKIKAVAEGHGVIVDGLKALKGIESEQEEHDRRIWVLEQAARAK